MYAAWLASEHFRIHVIEEWPDGPRKEAALSAARSAVNSLLRSAHPDVLNFHCSVCANRRKSVAVVARPAPYQLSCSSDLAA